MFGTNLATSPDDPRSLRELYDEFFPHSEDGICIFLSDDIGPKLRHIRDTRKKLFHVLYMEHILQAREAENKINEAILDQLGHTRSSEDTSTEMQVRMGEFSDEGIDANVKRDLIQWLIDQRTEFVAVLDNAEQEERLRFPPVAVDTADSRPIMEIFKAFFPDISYSPDIYDHIIELQNAKNQQTRNISNELIRHKTEISHFLWDILRRNQDESDPELQLEDLQDSHLLPGEKIKLVQEMIDQRDILLFKIKKALGRD